MNKSMVVAITDFKNALDLRFIKMGIIMAMALGPAMVILLIGVLVALPMIGGFGPASEAPGFSWKPSVHWMCKRQ